MRQAGATLHRGARASSPSRPLLLRSTGSRRAGSVIVPQGPSCSVACGIFPDQGSNPCPLHWQADSQPLRHQGGPRALLDRTPAYLAGLISQPPSHPLKTPHSSSLNLLCSFLSILPHTCRPLCLDYSFFLFSSPLHLNNSYLFLRSQPTL